MSILDSPQVLKELYVPSAKTFAVVDVPELRYIMVDGNGDPNNEMFANLSRWMFAVVHPLRLLGRRVMGKNFVEPPLECLWWADDMADFISGARDRWNWRLMIVADADFITNESFQNAVEEAAIKLGIPPASLRMENYAEGRSVQTMHIGPPGSQAATAKQMYGEYLPEHNLTPCGHYHEIYLTDTRRVAPEKQKTVLRQPVR